MSSNTWQKSSFSTSGGNAGCLELAVVEEAVAFRESDEPGVVLMTTPSRLAALLRSVRARPL